MAWLLLACVTVKPGTDSGCGAPTPWYLDADGDGYGAPGSVVEAGCPPAGHVPEGGDCDDAAPAVHPGAEETWYDGADQDCSGGSDFDQDGDGYPRDRECDDLDPARNPAAGEVEVWYDGVDDDCDGNDGDQDGDGWYVAGYPHEVPAPYAARTGDCADDPAAPPAALNGLPPLTAADVYPGAADAPYDGVDQDCAGDDDFDQDGDTHRTDAWPDGAGDAGDDCDDTDPAAFPGAPELCDGLLQDCAAGAWSAAVEAGRASVLQDGAWSDVTGLVQGSPGAPASWTLPEGSTTWLCAGTWYSLLVVPGGAPVEVRGRDGADRVVLDGQGAGSVVTQSAGAAPLLLAGLTVQGGAAVSGGGVTSAGELRVEDCVVADNEATDEGGGLHVIGGEVVVERTLLRTNRAGTAGGGAYLGNTDATFTDVSFAENGVAGLSAYGGGLAFGQTGSEGLRLERVAFLDNDVRGTTGNAEGGGLYAWSYGDVAMNDVTWSGNAALAAVDAYGGGLLLVLMAGAWTCDACSWDGNRATGADTAYGGGARVYHEGAGDATLTDPAFSANQASGLTTPAGGGLLYGGYATGTFSSAGGSFAGNRTVDLDGLLAGIGGGAYVEPRGGTVSLVDVTFDANESGLGGGVEVAPQEGGSAALVRASLTDNVGGGLLYYAADATGTASFEDSVATGHAEYGVFLFAAAGGSVDFACTGDEGADAGVYANPGYGVVGVCALYGGACSFVATRCDFGEEADDNASGDLYIDGVTGPAQGADATFTCADATCG